MKTAFTICDQCEKELQTLPMRYGKSIYHHSTCTVLHYEQREYHFCRLDCVKEWIGSCEEPTKEITNADM